MLATMKSCKSFLTKKYDCMSFCRLLTGCFQAFPDENVMQYKSMWFIFNVGHFMDFQSILSHL